MRGSSYLARSKGLKTNSIGGSMTVRADGTHQAFNRNAFSRRSFITQASCFGAFYALAKTIPLPALAETVGQDSRVSSSPLVDKGFASVRKVGAGLYATISDPSKGTTTYCNGGFLVGKDAALLIEGYSTVAGASFQMDALRSVSQVPVKGALDTHYHYDHSMGNAFYGTSGVPLWHNELSKATFRCRVPTKLRCSGRSRSASKTPNPIRNANTPKVISRSLPDSFSWPTPACWRYPIIRSTPRSCP